MGSNKEWQIDNTFTAAWDPDQEVDHIMPQVESLTVNSFDAHTPDMFAAYDYMELKKKYPALQQAWDHYQMVLKMCRAKEAENAN